MRTIHLIYPVIFLLLGIRAGAQTCSSLLLKKGSVITVNRQSFMRDYPALKAYMALSDDEKRDSDRKFAKDIEEGKIQPKTDDVVITVSDIVSKDGAAQFNLANLIRGNTYNTHMLCSNNIMMTVPEKDVVFSDLTTPKGNTVKTNALGGYNKMPLSLKTGDKLPGYQDLSFTCPGHPPCDGWVTHTANDASPDVWNTSLIKKEHTDIISFSLVKYANRQVLGEEDLVIDGVTYKAYQVFSEVWSVTSTSGQSNFMASSLAYEVTKNAIDPKTHEPLKVNTGDYSVTSLTAWFVPALGLSVKTDMYDAKGTPIIKMGMKDIK